MRAFPFSRIINNTMKKAIWINPLSTCSTSLDISVNPHDVDTLAVSSMLEAQGFEVFLHEPYSIKSRKSSFKNIITTDELKNFDADIAIILAGYFYIDFFNSKFNTTEHRGINFVKTMQWLMKFKGEVLIFAADPRPTFKKIFTVSEEVIKISLTTEISKLFDIFNNSRIIAASPSIVDDTSRVVTCDYWKLLEMPVLDWNPNYIYESVYIGTKAQTSTRLKLIKNWYEGSSNCFTAGNIKIKGLNSLTNFNKCSLGETLNFTNRSKTTLICGEVGHTWLTPRVLQSLTCGTIASVHPEFAGAQHLPSFLLDNQTCSNILKFDNSLLTKEIYNKQLKFVGELKKEVNLINF